MTFKKIFNSISMLSRSAIRFYSSNNEAYMSLQAPENLSANVELVFPEDGGSSGQVLSTDGSGNLSWQSPVSPGSINLDDLEDVDAPAPNDGDVLTWVDVDGAWEASPASSSGANTALSNLVAPTAVNEDLIVDKTTGFTLQTKDATASSKDLSVFSGDSINGGSGSVNIASGTLDVANPNVSGALNLSTGDAPGGNTGSVILSTGAAGDANSGPIDIHTGSSPDTSGDINLATGIAGVPSNRGNIGLTAKVVYIDSSYLLLPIAQSDPTASEGSIYYNDSTHKLRLYDGTTWVDLN